MLYHYPAFEWSDRGEESEREEDKQWDTWEESIGVETVENQLVKAGKPPAAHLTPGDNNAHRPHSLSSSIGAVLRRTQSNLSNLSIQSDLFMRVPRSRGRLEVSISELCSYIKSTPSAPDAMINTLIRRKVSNLWIKSTMLFVVTTSVTNDVGHQWCEARVLVVAFAKAT